jgi:RNA polymerase primary sigma factor
MRMRRKDFGKGVLNTMQNRKNIEKYLNEIRHFSGLSEEEEIELSHKVKNGDKRAEDKMVKANLRLVVSLANSYGTIMPLEDMIQDGNIGLIIAVREFDPTLGYRFISFATMMIRKYILIGIANDARIVRRPADEQTELSTSESLDTPAYDDDADTSKGDMLVGDIWVNTDLDSLACDLARAMHNTLDNRAIDIVCKVMGIGCVPMFMDAISKELGLTKERVRQVYQESLAAMRKDAKVAKLLANYKG